MFTLDFSYELLIKHFRTNSLKGFGIEDFQTAVIAAGAAMHYLSETHHDKLGHISHISRIEEDKYVWLDKFTIRNLELIFSPNPDAVTLLDVIDRTVSPMGSRMLKKWIVMPLKEKQTVRERHDIVDYLIDYPDFTEVVKSNFKIIGDLSALFPKLLSARLTRVNWCN